MEENLKNLVDDINEARNNEYTFVTVLKEEDRAEFIASLSVEERKECYSTKSISLNRWLEIMENMNLKNTYIIYRRNYWDDWREGYVDSDGDEDTTWNDTNKRKIYTSCVTPKYIFTESKPTIKSYFKTIKSYFKKPVRILCFNGKMTIIGREYNILGSSSDNVKLQNDPYY